ncbi:MAG: ACT domain-containing protein [Breznakia sp.]
MRAVISVVGKDGVGIIAKVATRCADASVNIVDISQTLMQGIFTMTMLVDLAHICCEYQKFVSEMERFGELEGLKVHVMHEDIFNSMHTI